MKINREDLLVQLESVRSGLATREIIEQSSCFVFQDGLVHTFNDEILCSQPCSLHIEGAVQGKPLLSILQKLPGTNISITTEKNKLVITDKKRRATIRMESKILLPMDAVKIGTKWEKISTTFSEAIRWVGDSAGTDETQFLTTCIHLHPDYIEACDNFRAARYKIKIPVRKPTVVRKSSIFPIIYLGMNKLAESKKWISFQNANGLILSCRRFFDPFEDLTELFKVKGSSIALPKNIGEAVERAHVFSAENAEDDDIVIHLQPNQLSIKGTGAFGSYVEVKKAEYSGKSRKFLIPPQLLIDIVGKNNNVKISKKRLKLTVGKFTFVSALTKVKK